MAAPAPSSPPFDVHETRQLGINTAAWLCTGVAVCTVAMKLYTKARIVKMVGWDDFIILLSMTLSIIAAALVSSAVTQGLGRHTAVVLAEPDGAPRLVNTLLQLQVGYALHIGAFSFPNIAIALLVVQLLDRNVWRAGALYALVGTQAAAAAAAMAVVLGQCGGAPPQHPAESPSPSSSSSSSLLTSPSAACWNPHVFNDFSYFVAAYTALTDAVLAAVPVAAFWRLQMPARTKLGVCLLMGLTLLSAVVTVVKACYLHLFTDAVDPLWNVVPLVVWSLIEQNVVIVAACIPTLRPFFTKGVLLPVHHHHHHGPSSSSSGAVPPHPGGAAASWLGSWRAMKTRHGHRRLFSAWGGGGGRRRWAASASDVLPLRHVDRRAAAAAAGRRSPPLDPDDAASQKGIMRTVAVAMEWDVPRPLSARSATTDWLVPPPPPPAAKGGGPYAPRRDGRLGG